MFIISQKAKCQTGLKSYQLLATDNTMITIRLYYRTRTVCNSSQFCLKTAGIKGSASLASGCCSVAVSKLLCAGDDGGSAARVTSSPAGFSAALCREC